MIDKVNDNNNGVSKKTIIKQKISDPILNVKQVTGLIMSILYSIIADLMPVLMGEDVNVMYILINFGISVGIYLLLSFMRAAGVKEVPNMSVVTNLKLFFERIIDSVVTPRDKDAGEKMKLLENIIMWTVREWDSINNKELSSFGEYFHDAIDKAVEAEKALIEK